MKIKRKSKIKKKIVNIKVYNIIRFQTAKRLNV